MNNNDVINLIKDRLPELEIKTEEFMKNHTYFKIGGPADIMVFPREIKELSEIIKICSNNNIDYFVLGNGTNLLVRDKGIRGLIIKIDDNLNEIRVEGNKIIAQAGSKVSKVSKVALKNSLTGLERISGIPGSLGGGVAMNAGAYGTELKDVVTKVKCINTEGEIKEYTCEEMHFGYRHSRVHEEKLLVAEVQMELEEGDYDKIKETMDDYTNRRNTKQPIDMPSAGSTFKRPEGDYAGRLIDVSGLRGARYKDAQVSEKHCGFIVNRGNAKCEDVITLIGMIQKTVKDKHGVELEREVLIIGEE